MKQKSTENYTSGVLEFEDNILLPSLYGEHNVNLARIEHEFGCELSGKGNLLSIEGPEEACNLSRDVLLSLYQRLEEGGEVTIEDVNCNVFMVVASKCPTVNVPGVVILAAFKFPLALILPEAVM